MRSCTVSYLKHELGYLELESTNQYDRFFRRHFFELSRLSMIATTTTLSRAGV